MKKVQRLYPFLVLLSFLVSSISANYTNLKTIDTNAIRNGRGSSRLHLPNLESLEAVESLEDSAEEAELEAETETELPADAEPPTEVLQAELRMPHPLAHSEVIQLLGDDETRSHDPGQPSKHPASGTLPMDGGRMDCSKITVQIFQVLLQNPDSVEPEDYSCGLLNLISQFEKSHGRIRSLEASLHSASTTIKTLESNFQAEISKTQFLMKEMNETLHKETERAIKAENVIARRVLAEKARVDVMQKNVTEMLGSALVEIKDFEGTLKDMEKQLDGVSSSQSQASPSAAGTGISPAGAVAPVSQLTEQDLLKIEIKLNSLHDFIKELSNRISQMEDGSEENVNKGITQIFKTYASLANEIEKETERATGEEQSLRSLVSTEISTLAKQIHALQERITEEKNRVQVIENRRTADLFEEINRAKSEENRLGQKLKDEMSKAAAAFKRLELHVDGQMNTTKLFEDELKVMVENVSKKAVETEDKLTVQMNFERTRALSVENSLKVHLETEVSRAMGAEESLKKLIAEEKERARGAEHDLKVATDVETYRAKGVEYSINAQLSVEVERAKLEEERLREEIKANMTRLLTDIIKEFTRAQSAEKDLDDKIMKEMNRAVLVEQNIMDNLNKEQSRASGRENDLYRMFKEYENSTELYDKIKSMLESETSRAQKAESELETQIQEEVNRAKVTEDNMRSIMGDELLHFKSVEHNLTAMSQDILKHAREVELEVRKTVMAEVARAVDAENGLKYQLAAEVERAIMAERSISSYQSANYSDFSMRLVDLTQEIEKDTGRLEDLSLQISRNLTGDLLTLAELFDDKLDDLERSENVRLKKLEDEMKKCCSTSSWRWRTPTSSKGKSTKGRSESVINKIMQAFGAVPESEEGTSKKKSKSSSKVNNGEGRAISSGTASLDMDIVGEASKLEEIEGKGPFENFEKINYVTSSPLIRNDTKLAESEVDEIEDKSKSYRTRERSSRRSDSNRRNTVSVQTANSKVTSTYG